MGFFSSCSENVVWGTCGSCRCFKWPHNYKTEWGECSYYGKADAYEKADSCRHYYEIKSKYDIVYKD